MFGYCVVQYVSLSVYARRTAGGGTRRQLHALAPAPRAAAAHGSPAIMRGCAADAQSMTEPMTGSRDIASPIPSEWTVELVWCVCVVCAAVEDQTESQGQTSVGRDSTLDTHKRREPDESQPARQSNPDQISNAQGSDLQCARIRSPMRKPPKEVGAHSPHNLYDCAPVPVRCGLCLHLLLYYLSTTCTGPAWGSKSVPARPAQPLTHAISHALTQR